MQFVRFIRIRHNGVGSGVDVPSHAEHSRMFRRVVGDILLRHIIAVRPGKAEICAFFQLHNDGKLVPASADLLLFFPVSIDAGIEQMICF